MGALGRRGLRRAGWWALLVLLAPTLPATAPAAEARDANAAADAAWARRAEGHEDARAAPAAAERAVHAAEAAVAADPSDPGARWRLLRALFFLGEFAAPGADARREVFDRAAEAAEQALSQLADRLGREEGLAAWLPPLGDGAEVPQEVPAMRAALERAGVAPGDAARLHFWAGIAWAGWAREHGVLGAVRKGVATRTVQHARVAAALDPDVDRGGPWRLLARLHADLPRVPFLTGWVDRARAVPAAERALALAPDFAGSRLTLALTLLEVAPARRAEALRLLEQVATQPPSPEREVETRAMRETARARLRRERGAAS